jgi:hypothetical protein
MTGAFRRVIALFVATVREAWLARSLVLAAALAAAWSLAGTDVLADAVAAPLRFERRLTLLCWLASGAALLAGAHAVGRDRRAGQLDAWRLSRARAYELLIGRALGAASQVALAVAPLFGWMLWFDEAAPCRHRERLAPRSQVAPARVERHLVDGSTLLWRRGPAQLDPGERVVLKFDALPEGGVELLLPCSGGLLPGSAPPRWTLRIDGEPVVVATGGDVSDLAIRRTWSQPPRVELELAPESGVVRVDLHLAALRGEPGALAPSLVRLALGHSIELWLSSLLGAALAVAMAEGLALAGGGVLLLLSNLRALFVDAAGIVREAHSHGTVEPALNAVAAACERLVALFPDLTALRGVGRAARGFEPWGEGDAFAFLAAAGALVAIAAPATWFLGRRPRGAS